MYQSLFLVENVKIPEKHVQNPVRQRVRNAVPECCIPTIE